MRNLFIRGGGPKQSKYKWICEMATPTSAISPLKINIKITSSSQTLNHKAEVTIIHKVKLRDQKQIASRMDKIITDLPMFISRNNPLELR